jgi:hypothetical protein
VTSLILRGSWKGKRFPGNRTFATNCWALSRAYVVKTPRRRHLPVLALFSVVERETEILDTLSPIHDKIVALLLRIAAHSSRWVRSVEGWFPKASYGAGQLSELVRHLFERYPTPNFFEAAWRKRRGLRIDWQAFEWYVHVAGGGNIRTAPDLPVALSRRAAHEFTAAPDDLAPRVALRWAQVRAAGVPARLVRAVLFSLVPSALDDPLWLTFQQKLATDAALRPEDVGPLVDYVRARSASDSFSLKGRTVDSLLEGMRRWHGALAQERYRTACLRAAPGNARWNPLSGVFSFAEQRLQESWEISELLCFDELFAEGRAMHHCVASYTELCRSGTTSIWSLRIRRPECETGRVTLRIDVPRRTVVEARRVSNQPIFRPQLRFIQKWAAENGLEVSNTILVER